MPSVRDGQLNDRSLGSQVGLTRLVNGALRLSAGTAVGQVITLGGTPVVAKMYGPEAFGVWAGWLAIAGVIGAVACLRYETAIALPDDNREALHVAAVATLLAAPICLVAGSMLVGAWMLNVPGPWQRLGQHIIWAPIGALVIAWVTVATQWLAREHQVAGLAKAKIWSSGVMAGVQLGLGWSGSANALIIGDMVGRGAGLWSRIREVWEEQAGSIVAIRREDMRKALRRYRTHSAWMTPTALVDTLGQQAPLLLMLSWYGGVIGGQFSLAQRLLTLPVALLGQSMAQLFAPAMAKAHRTSPHASLRLFLGLSCLLALVGLALIGVVWCLHESWLVYMLGSAWTGIGRFLLPLSLLVGIQLLVGTLSQTAIVLSGQKWYAIWVTLWVAASAGGLWIGHNRAGADGAVWGLLAGSGALYILLWLGLLACLLHLGRRNNSVAASEVR